MNSKAYKRDALLYAGLSAVSAGVCVLAGEFWTAAYAGVLVAVFLRRAR